MIQVTYADLDRAVPVLRKLMEKNMPIRLCFRFARLVEMIDQKLLLFYQMREKLMLRYCMLDDNGAPKIPENGEGGYLLDQTKIPEFNTEYQSLIETIETIDCGQFTIDELESITDTLTTQEVFTIRPFVSE